MSGYTTDTDALTERIGRILNDEGWTFEGVHEPGDYDECEDCRRVADPIAARIAQTVAAEVQAAKAEALREAADSVHDNAASPYCLPCHRDDAELLHTIAAEYETGDSDEHR